MSHSGFSATGWEEGNKVRKQGEWAWGRASSPSCKLGQGSHSHDHGRICGQGVTIGVPGWWREEPPNSGLSAHLRKKWEHEYLPLGVGLVLEVRERVPRTGLSHLAWSFRHNFGPVRIASVSAGMAQLGIRSWVWVSKTTPDPLLELWHLSSLLRPAQAERLSGGRVLGCGISEQ